MNEQYDKPTAEEETEHSQIPQRSDLSDASATGDILLAHENTQTFQNVLQQTSNTVYVLDQIQPHKLEKNQLKETLLEKSSQLSGKEQTLLKKELIEDPSLEFHNSDVESEAFGRGYLSNQRRAYVALSRYEGAPELNLKIGETLLRERAGNSLEQLAELEKFQRLAEAGLLSGKEQIDYSRFLASILLDRMKSPSKVNLDVKSGKLSAKIMNENYSFLKGKLLPHPNEFDNHNVSAGQQNSEENTRSVTQDDDFEEERQFALMIDGQLSARNLSTYSFFTDVLRIIEEEEVNQEREQKETEEVLQELSEEKIQRVKNFIESQLDQLGVEFAVIDTSHLQFISPENYTYVVSIHDLIEFAQEYFGEDGAPFADIPLSQFISASETESG